MIGITCLWELELTFNPTLFKVLMAPSPKYTGLRDEAPRFMGEGFVVVSSNEVNVYYYMDEVGREWTSHVS